VVVAGENGALRYEIIAGDSEEQFNIDAETGIVTVAKSLDRETRSRYDVTIQAVDQASEPAYRLSSTVVVSTQTFLTPSLGPFYGAIAVPSVTRCRCCRCCCWRCRCEHRFYIAIHQVSLLSHAACAIAIAGFGSSW